MGKKGKMPGLKAEGNMLFRSAVLDIQNADDDQRAIPLVLATDNPVKAADLKRMRIINEVLDMGGMEIGPSGKIPLLDSHNSDTVRSVLGSIRDLKVENGELKGTAYFSEDAADVYRKYRDGDLTDFSVGGKKQRIEMSRDNQTRFVRKWRLDEGSAVIRGQDPGAKAMSPMLREYFDPLELLEEEMDTKLKEALVARGMPADLDDDKVLGWVQNDFAPEQDAPEAVKREYSEFLELLKQTPELTRREQPLNVDPEKIAKDALKRYEEVDELCRKHKIDDKQRKEWLNSDISRSDVAAEILKRMSKNGDSLGQDTIEVIKDRREKFYDAVSDGLVQRAARGQVNPKAALEYAKDRYDSDAIKRSEELVRVFTTPAEGYDVFRNSSLSDIARMYLDEAGVDTRRMTREQVSRAAMRHRGLFDSDIQRSDGAYHTTGSFSNLMLDAANKTLLAAYDEAPTTYQMWVRQAPSASDFKQLNRIRFGELADPEVVPENFPYPEKSTSDNKESYAVEKYGEIFSISWEAVINDDLNAISRIPAMEGNAMRRKINKVCYSVLTDNAALSDGVALFHATSHGANLDATALATGALDTGYTVMRTQTGLSGSGTPLNIQPRYLIVPASLEATAYQIQGSTADPAVGGDTTGSSGVQNIYGPNGPRRLVVVSDAQLDDTSTTGWYLAADPMVVDTVEITFLQGYESPVLSRESDFEVDTMKYKITQVFAAKAIDYRGLYQGNS